MGGTCSNCCGEDHKKHYLKPDGNKKEPKKVTLVGFNTFLDSTHERSAAVTTLIQNNSIRDQNNIKLSTKLEPQIIHEEKYETMLDEEPHK